VRTTQNLLRCALRFCLASFFLFAASARANVAGSISGTVKDPSDRVVAHAEVTAREVNTGLSYRSKSDESGFYTFPVLPVGRYDLEIFAAGFASYARIGIVLDTGAAITIDATLAINGDDQTVTVADNGLHAETISTELGQVITGTQILSLPLNGRSYTDLLLLQPGVAPASAIAATTVQDVGATILNPSGTLNPGNLSVNGQRETANYFSVNGSDAEEDVNAGTAIIPNLDAIAEFRIVTGDFDAEFGEYSGGQISVVTKSGTNGFHGSAFEFLRNTALDSRNYFSSARGVFQQNQFGGTAGGPVRRNKVFYFGDYQGTRQNEGIDTPQIAVPSEADRTGNLMDFTTGTEGNRLNGVVSGPYLVNILARRLGYPVTQGEPYYLAGCTQVS